MDNNDIIESIVNRVIKNINPNWNKLQKIRYIYLELGNYLEKNTDFFLNDKLDKLALSKEEISEIYNDNKIIPTKRPNSKEQYQIICKSAALLLKKAYDKLGIESNLIRTIANNNGVYHWFVVAKDDNNNQYFLTLVADLPYIKNDLPTLHFANNLKYFNPSGKPIYEIPEDANIELCEVSYKTEHNEEITGQEIKHKSLVIDNKPTKELIELDKSIGYGKLYDSIKLIENKKMTDIFTSLMEANYDIHKIYRNSFNIEAKSDKRIDTITPKQVEKFKKSLEEYVGKQLLKEEYKDSESIKTHLLKILKDINIQEENSNLSAREILTKYRKELKESNYKEIVNMLNEVSTIENRFDNYLIAKSKYANLLNRINQLKENNNDKIYELQLELIELEKELDNAKINLSINKLTSLLNALSFHFYKDKLIMPKDEYVPLDYVVTKFETMFPVVFDCNYEEDNLTKFTSFSIQSYSEQIFIIKEMLKKIFYELTEKNSKDIEDYNFNYSAIENRIQTYPLKDKITGEYCIGFRFGCKPTENTVHYIYIPSKNLLRRREPIKDKEKYWIVSERFNEDLQKVEEIEEYITASSHLRK